MLIENIATLCCEVFQKIALSIVVVMTFADWFVDTRTNLFMNIVVFPVA